MITIAESLEGIIRSAVAAAEGHPAMFIGSRAEGLHQSVRFAHRAGATPEMIASAVGEGWRVELERQAAVRLAAS